MGSTNIMELERFGVGELDDKIGDFDIQTDTRTKDRWGIIGRVSRGRIFL